MNNRKPSKPNLSSIPKPFKLLAPTRLRRTFVFFRYNPYHQPISIGPFLTASQAPNNLLTDMGMVRKGFDQCTSQGCNNGEGESRGILRIKLWRLWMSQSCFSLRFLSQNSLWKLSTIRGYKGYLYWCVFGMRKVSFSHNRVVWRLGLTIRLSHEFKS